jgi:antitoxin VapB
MALNIKNIEVEKLAAEVATLTGETKTEAIGKALLERKNRLAFQVKERNRKEKMVTFLESEIWPSIPPGMIGKGLSRKEEDRLLGYGREGI